MRIAPQSGEILKLVKLYMTVGAVQVNQVGQVFDDQDAAGSVPFARSSSMSAT